MDMVKESLRHIVRKKSRSLLTMIGIGIGVLSVILISIIGEVGKRGIQAELDSMGIGGLHISATGSQLGVRLFGAEELDLVQQNNYVEEVTPFITKTGNIRVHGIQSQAVVWGIDANAADIVSLQLLHGRLLNREDVQQYNRVCIVDESFAQKFYCRSNIVGKSIELWSDGKYLSFEVIGVVESGGNLLQSVMGGIVPTFLYAPYPTVLQDTAAGHFSQMVAKLADGADESQAAEALSRGLGAQLGISDGIKIENLNGQKDQLNSILDIVVAVLSVIGGISLLVAGLSIMTVMLVTVQERTREIGIKKSIGASRGMILAEFLAEALILSLSGSLLGVIVGVLFGLLVGAFFGMGFVISWGTVGFCVLFCVLIGGLFGVYPAMQAAKLNPVDALRCE